MLLQEKLSYEIIGSAMEVLNAVRPGQSEKIYENALTVEFKLRGIPFSQQQQFPVIYKDTLVGTLVPDLLVASKIIVDTKVVTNFSEPHVAQMLGYLAVTRCDLAIILNFKDSKLTWKRVLPPEKWRSSADRIIEKDGVRIYLPDVN